MRLGVVIPALDEEDEIAGAVAAARLLEPVEVVVVDACSGDRTAARARAAGARVLAHPGPRGAALNAAVATLAPCDAVVFLHADTRLGPGAGVALRAALADPAVAGGAFRLRFDRPGRTLALAAAGANARARVLGVAYGDQAVFARRPALAAIGGLRPWPLWDDADLCRRLRAAGRFVLLRERAVTSARRHAAHGALRTCARVWWLTARFRLGTPPERLAAAWWPRLPDLPAEERERTVV